VLISSTLHYITFSLNICGIIMMLDLNLILESLPKMSELKCRILSVKICYSVWKLKKKKENKKCILQNHLYMFWHRILSYKMNHHRKECIPRGYFELNLTALSTDKFQLTEEHDPIQRNLLEVHSRHHRKECIPRHYIIMMLPNHNLQEESNYWEYLQAILATWQTYWFEGTCCATKKSRTCSSCRLRSLILADWTLFFRRPTLNVHTKCVPLSLCLRGWVLG